jgi:hypothetical protein
MRKIKWGAAIGVGAAVLAVSGVAAAALPGPTTIGRAGAGGAPQVLVDSGGTVNVLYTGSENGGLAITRYAREPAGAKHFTQVALPGMPSTDGAFIYAPSPGTLEVIVTVNGPLDLAAWTSTNDGVSWTEVPTTAQEKWSANGLYLQASALFDAPGGPLDYAGNDGDTGSIVQLNSSLSQATAVGSNIVPGIIVTRLGRSSDGTVFLLGAPTNDQQTAAPTTLPFQAGTSTGMVTFPCGGTSAVAGTDDTMAVGRSLAVVTFAGCGHVWTRTITAAGAVGPLETIGTSPGSSTGALGGRNGIAWVGLTADRRGGFTAAYTVPGNDVGVARSSDGSHWKIAPGLVPAQGVSPIYGTSGWSLSRGSAAWLGLSPQTSNNAYLQQLLPLSETYRPPSAPSGRGISSAHSAQLGSLAATVPGAIAKRGFEKTGKATVKLVDALGGKVTASIAVTSVKGTTTTDICSGSGTVKLRAGVVKSIALPCSSGAIVIGGSASTLPAVNKGDQAAFSITGRNGLITIVAKIR